jgi:hypothetical protein
VSEERKFKYLEPRNLNQDVHENTLCAICLHCGSNSNPSVGQFLGFWPKVETISTVCSAARFYKLSCPLSEKALVETDLYFCTVSQLHSIALNMLMTCGVTCTTVTLSFTLLFILQCVNIFPFSTVLCIYIYIYVCVRVCVYIYIYIYMFFFALCIDMNNGAVIGHKSATTLCPEGNTTTRNWIMFDILIANIFVDL